MYFIDRSANSGCYFVRNNAKTKYFFSSFLMNGVDRILRAQSHQVIMHATMSHHASHYGLRVKTLTEESYLVPRK